MTTTETRSAPPKDAPANSEDDGSSIPHHATPGNHERPDATAVEGRGGPLLRRTRDMAIVGGLIAKHKPSPREIAILIDAWSKAADLDDRIFELLLERLAPDRRCADHRYLMAFSDPRKVGVLIRARLGGWLPDDVVDDTATVAGELAFGATVKIAPLRRTGARHAA